MKPQTSASVEQKACHALSDKSLLLEHSCSANLHAGHLDTSGGLLNSGYQFTLDICAFFGKGAQIACEWILLPSSILNGAGLIVPIFLQFVTNCQSFRKLS